MLSGIFANVAGAAGVVALAILAFILVGALLAARKHAYQVIMPNLTDGSGASSTDLAASTVAGLSAEALRELNHQIDVLKAQTLSVPGISSTVATSDWDSLLTTLGKVASGNIGTAAQLLQVLVRSETITVAGTLQCRGQMPGQIGFTYVITSSTGAHPPLTFDVLELPPTDSGIHDPTPAKSIDPKAQAAYTLGQVYAQRGAYAAAKTQFETALQAQPDYPDAQQALLTVLGENWSLSSRYFAFLPVAMRALAIELLRHHLLVQSSSAAPAARANYEAAVLYDAATQDGTLGNASGLDELAERRLKVVQDDPNHGQYRELAQKLTSERSKRARRKAEHAPA